MKNLYFKLDGFIIFNFEILCKFIYKQNGLIVHLLLQLVIVKETILLKGLQFSQDAFNLNKNYAAKQNNGGKQFVLCNELMTWEELETKNNSTDEQKVRENSYIIVVKSSKYLEISEPNQYFP